MRFFLCLTTMTSLDLDADPRQAGLRGELAVYGRNLQFFESGPLGSSKKVVVLGGLSDGLLACPYVPRLAAALADEWSTVQPVLRSSYAQFGFASLDSDVEDLTQLVDVLRERRGLEELAICGHSTGAQIAAHFVRTAKDCAELRKVIFQAGVSDRETDDPEERRKQAKYLAVADAFQDKTELLPRDAFWAPITAQRYLDLFQVDGTDDYFSSDLGDDVLFERFRRLRENKKLRALVAYSGADEYAPPSVDKEALVARLVAAMGTTTATGIVIPGADHALSSGSDAQAAFIRHVTDFLLQKDDDDEH
mmetsp:Transcript_1335/g.4546  ORF Transcript_1335/g.4546 Transcript_1335/m.4546 type:complete len:307 (+) Transcript_1335:39-959(+)